SLLPGKKVGTVQPGPSLRPGRGNLAQPLHDQPQALPGAGTGEALKEIDSESDKAGDDVEVHSPGAAAQVGLESLVDLRIGFFIQGIGEAATAEVLGGPGHARETAVEVELHRGGAQAFHGLRKRLERQVAKAGDAEA